MKISVSIRLFELNNIYKFIGYFSGFNSETYEFCFGRYHIPAIGVVSDILNPSIIEYGRTVDFDKTTSTFHFKDWSVKPAWR